MLEHKLSTTLHYFFHSVNREGFVPVLRKHLPQMVRVFRLTASHRLMLRCIPRPFCHGLSLRIITAHVNILFDRLAVVLATRIVAANLTAEPCQSPAGSR